MVVQGVLERTQEPEDECGGRPWEIDWLAATAVEADPLRAAQEVAKELKIDHSMVIWHLKQIGKVKRLDRWVSHELIENEKNRSFEMSSSLNLCINSEPFLSRIVTCDERWISYNNWQ